MPQPTLSIIEIESIARAFAAERQKLVEAVSELNDELEHAKRVAMPRIRRALARTTDAQSVLINAIDGNRHLFAQPRSITVDGIKVGLQKSKDTVAFDDAETVAGAVFSEMPDQFATFVKREHKPIVAALLQLDPETLKRIHCRLVEGKDEVLVKPTGSEIDKLLAKLTAELQGDAMAAVDGEAA